MTPTPRERAEDLVRATAERATRPRIEVLAMLLAAPHALSHHDIERRLNRAPGVDRVTIYRVLEWLVRNGLAHRIQGDDRIWRFNAADAGHAQHHAHFKCSRCGTVTCLDEPVKARSVSVPSGFRPQEIELTVKGICAGCAPA